ncbi:MAG: helix-turn-helix domain-containing protein, partial [Candidatus Dormiibacterota bacterium]
PERGYTATTVDAISNLADVPTPTVYRLFGSKLGILKALLDADIAGDDEPVAVQDRPAIARLFAESDATTLLAAFAGITSAINQRTNAVYWILVSAADSDPAAAELLDDLQQQRDRGQGQIAHALVRAGSLGVDLQEDDAIDLIHALMSPELYRLLVTDRHWKPERYQYWLATSLIQQLT